ncbi:MAG TPA: molybdopterin oxidoreductase family protein [Stellaceae bacterium]|nr:molybdopterin oxidoreductase family protein [Stellaceae bacterium]
MPRDFVASVCPHDCPSTCALEVERLDSSTIGRVHGRKDHPYTAGIVCTKVSRYAERQHHPQRLRTPLRRTGDRGAGWGAFVPIAWDEALDRVAEAFARAVRRHGSETVWPYYYAGTMGLVQRDGINRLRHVLRYSREHLTICNMLSDSGWLAGAGVKRGVDAREIPLADLVVMWGGNPVATQVNVMSHITRARKERGAPFVVIDPYRTPTADVADSHLALRPGTDGALACAVMHVLFKEGYADRAYLAAYTAGADKLEAHLRSRDPAWAASITGLTEAAIVDFARLYGRTKRSYLRIGYGFSRTRNGAAQLFATSCLPAVTGAWQYEGGGALYANGGGIYKLDRGLIEGLDAVDPSTRILDQSRIGPVLTGDRRDLGDGPPVTALLIQNTNPMVVAPESNAVRRGFSRDDLFTCVHEQFLTETAAMADIVLPATTMLEHDDIYTAGAHTFLQVARKVVEPFAEARSNHFVICTLAKRLGAEHPGFHLTEWEIIDRTLAASRLPDAATIYGKGGHDLALPFATAHFLDGFGHADKRFHFEADWAAIGANHEALPPLPDHVAVIDRADGEHPFRMVAPPARSFLNTSFNNLPSSLGREGRPTVRVHPDDLAALGLGDGARVRLGNRRGTVVLQARAFDGLQRGVLVVEGIWPNHAFEEGIGINALVSADPGLPNGGAVFHDTAVWLRAADCPLSYDNVL